MCLELFLSVTKTNLLQTLKREIETRLSFNLQQSLYKYFVLILGLFSSQRENEFFLCKY